ncbi:hypothetical protein NCU03547 [Neurospora crassa OR74A]|uniref:Uncharacterized protein n=2 Tax=Neurospora crassa TaxID=5141 RepID=Q1K5C8_NEUCR|nr:hypothetical protein NCU03547 [Neurospora crassa OR74A]EAA27590.1 hypothetical protein NCU03547 [Neurospora crassa OR74A]CAD21058.1 hypothetical protein [Neurospora crassa]|eukprot:XP_956826.1 hypothetical protein NCU03547 [Neurospora crassa OR74A]
MEMGWNRGCYGSGPVSWYTTKWLRAELEFPSRERRCWLTGQDSIDNEAKKVRPKKDRAGDRGSDRWSPVWRRWKSHQRKLKQVNGSRTAVS